MADADDQQINLPSLVAILVVSGLIIRYLFFTPPSAANGRSGAAGRAGAAGTGAATASSRDPGAQLRAREAAVEHIQQMFPQVDRRAALWDLQRSGGSVAATTERILAGRLETPPITFQPPPPPGDSNGSNNAASRVKPAPGPAHRDLITRYNLRNKIRAAESDSDEPSSGTEAIKKGGKGWSTNREERQSLLQKRRDQMILEARRKMQAKLTAEKAAKRS
ncbi:CUE domain-containing protein [Chaetomium tenue]|uniref:CUE domain-containing protein n=1 Tax=Chaetomium tenue TaxID=1854479 RepID=A0ACB7PAD5_9PEZI|nr:CUE domain-containing protein [Chaetomium globosum]